jgi:hypothetical protein
MASTLKKTTYSKKKEIQTPSEYPLHDEDKERN